LLSQLGDAGVQEVVRLLDAEDEDMRMVAFRALRQAAPERLLTFSEKLAADPSPRVRREVIIALTDFPLAEKNDLLLKLATAYDGSDRWYLEALGAAMAGHEPAFYAALKKVFNADGQSADQWDQKFASLAWRLHPPAAVSDLKVRASSASLDERARSRAVTALAFINTREAVQAMIALTKDPDKTIAEQATYWVTFRQGNDWFALWDWKKSPIDLAHERNIAVMKVKRKMILDDQMPLHEKKRNARALATNPVGMQMLLGIVAEEQLPRPLYPFVEELIAQYGDEKVRFQAASYFTKDDIKDDYRVDRISALAGHANAGESVFARTCQTCHRVGKKGATIGPDLSAIGSKFDKSALLDAIIHPDAGIVFGYEAWTITLKDGQSHFGFIVADGPETVTIRDLAGNNHVIRTGQVVSRARQEKSLMPPPAMLGLKEQDLADVVEYLGGMR
ncbi:MAG: HEAT repeat domain-containing protein, partial [Bacteroidota bacterium]|nr:HEAT repeat domain-containing protein [Bacteroidota bacterium]